MSHHMIVKTTSANPPRASRAAAPHVRPAPHESSVPDVQVWLQASNSQGQTEVYKDLYGFVICSVTKLLPQLNNF